MVKNNALKFKLGQHKIEKAILGQARKEGNIIFGSQAIKRKLGINARPPSGDYDLFSDMPKSSANKTETKLDKSFKKDLFFTKKGANPSTWKVKFKGRDGKALTKDDIGVADYTKTPKPKPKTFKFRGVNYRTLNEELKAKKKLISDKQFDFRRKKDLEDFLRIKKFGRIK